MANYNNPNNTPRNNPNASYTSNTSTASSSGIMDVIQQIRSSAQNLSKDLDNRDSREETAGDLEQLTLSFADLKKIFFALKQEDKEILSREVRELLSGQEDFKTYTRDVNKILMDVKNRIQADKTVEAKVKENLPEEHQGQAPNALLQGFGKLLEQVSDWSSSPKPGPR